MKNNKIKVINPNKYENFIRLPKSISKNETFEPTIAEKITPKEDEKLNELAKSKNSDVLEYKKDLLLKFNIENKENS